MRHLLTNGECILCLDFAIIYRLIPSFLSSINVMLCKREIRKIYVEMVSEAINTLHLP